METAGFKKKEQIKPQVVILNWTNRKNRRIPAKKDYVCRASNARYFPDRLRWVTENSVCFSQRQPFWKQFWETQSFSQIGSASADIQDRCHWQVRSYSSLGDQILYFTTHTLGCIFNLGHLLRNFFFLQRIKITYYCLPLNLASFSFKGKVGYVSHKAKAENQELGSNKPLWQHCGKEPRGQLNNPKTRN